MVGLWPSLTNPFHPPKVSWGDRRASLSLSACVAMGCPKTQTVSHGQDTSITCGEGPCFGTGFFKPSSDSRNQLPEISRFRPKITWLFWNIFQKAVSSLVHLPEQLLHQIWLGFPKGSTQWKQTLIQGTVGICITQGLSWITERSGDSQHAPLLLPSCRDLCSSLT